MWVLSSISLINMFVLMPIPCCFLFLFFCNSIVKLKIWGADTQQYFLIVWFFQFDYPGSFIFPYET